MPTLLKPVCVLAALAIATVAAHAQESYPRRADHDYQPLGGGGINDVAVRLVSEHMAENFSASLW